MGRISVLKRWGAARRRSLAPRRSPLLRLTPPIAASHRYLPPARHDSNPKISKTGHAAAQNQLKADFKEGAPLAEAVPLVVKARGAALIAAAALPR